MKSVRAVCLAIVVAMLGLALARQAEPAPAPGSGHPRPAVVLTRNLYLGADLTSLATASNLIELAVAGSAVWSELQATDFPSRAKALAAEVAAADPALVGLQEVALWRTGAPDGPPALGGSAASTVVLDFLEILLGELQARGTPYEVVQIQPEADLEFPTASGFDLRLTLRDVILAKAGLPPGELVLARPASANFSTNLSLSLLGGAASVTVLRGWTSVDVTLNRRSFRLVNTHLEAFSNCIRTLQALELLFGPLGESTLPVVLVGDLNSAPDDPVFSEPGCPLNGALNPYVVLTLAGLVDSWLEVNPGDPGFTCCNASDLSNPVPLYSERIDHVLVTAGAGVYRARRTGVDPDSRTDDGLWPSDHAGVVTAVAP